MRLGPTVEQVLKVVEPLYQGHIPRRAVVKSLNEHLGTHNLRFKSKSNHLAILDWVAVSGYYDPVDDTRVVELVHAPHLKRIFVSDIMDFCFLISQTIKHETIHQRQLKYKYDKRYKVGKKDFRYKYKHQEARYLADPEEIHAYAHDIALEILFYYPKKNPYRVLSDIDRTRKLASYNYYRSVFQRQPWVQVRDSLHKHVKKWLPHVNL